MSTRLLRRCLLLTLLCLLGSGAHAVEPVRGMPLLQRYLPDDYQAAASNLAVLPTPEGMLYVGNGEGLLRFDGVHWDRLELPQRSIVRALALGPHGELYLGGYDQFGVVRTDASGRMRYEDLRPAFGLDPAKVSFGVVWSVLRGQHGVWFHTTDRLYFLADDGNHRQWPSSEALRAPHAIGDELYARVDGRGLCRFVDGEWELLPGGERFVSQPLLALFPDGDGLLLVSPEGFLRADARGIRLLPGEAGRVFAAHEPYVGLQLPDRSVVLGTYTGELLQFSPEHRFQAVNRVAAYTVLDLGYDREGGVWAATEADLVRLRLPAPWTQFGSADGLIGAVSDTAYHDGALWVATSQGVYRSRDTLGQIRFELAIETTLEANALHSDGESLLAGDRDGVLLLAKGAARARRLATTSTVYEFKPSKFVPGRIYAVGELELVALDHGPDGWRIGQRWPLGGISLSVFHEYAANEFVFGDYRSGVVRWKLDPATGAVVERRTFGAAEGLVIDDDYGLEFNMLDGDLYAVSGRRTFRLQGSRFVEVDLAPFNRVERPWELVVEDTPVGTYAWTSRELLRRPPGSTDWLPVQLGSSSARGYSSVQMDADGLLRVVTWSGLLQFDPSVPERELPPLAVGLRRLDRRLPDGSVQALPLARGEPVTLPAAATLDVDFRLLTMEPNPQFRFRIPGLIDEFTPWSPPSSPSLTMRNPGAGDYVIEIEGRTRSGRIATPLALAVHAEPPWWQTAPALLGALLGVLLLIGGIGQLIARIRYRQYVTLNHRLERRIAERTAELEAANRKLGELATEDSLTGVANRRALEQALLREWERCRELRQPLSVVMVDVDHFKQYNDVHGHLAGDQQLVRVARILATHVRPVRELLARFGGEEFSLVLPGIGIEDAMQRAEQMRQAFVTGEPGPTISAGVASVYPNTHQVPDDLVRAADLALYAAKRAGRNRVVRAAPLSEPTASVASMS